MIFFPQLETNITTYCQNRCVSCNHIIPLVEKPQHLDPSVIERDLTAMAKICHARDYSLVGGEPTSHPQIMDIISIVKRSGIATSLVMYTNGQSLRHLPDAFYQELDRLIVTPYKLHQEDVIYISEKCATYGLPLEWHSTNFTRSFYKQRHNIEYATALYRSCWFRFNRNVIDNGHFYRCCTSPFIPFYLLGQTHEADGLPIDGITEERLNAYINQAETPEICYVCGSNNSQAIGWRETTREKWLEESLG